MKSVGRGLMFWWWLNISWGNDLVPSGNKPLPQPMLSNICNSIGHHQTTLNKSRCPYWMYLPRFHCFLSPHGQRDCAVFSSVRHQDLHSFWKYNLILEKNVAFHWFQNLIACDLWWGFIGLQDYGLIFSLTQWIGDYRVVFFTYR